MNDNLSSMITPKNLVKDNLSRVMPLRSKGVESQDLLYKYQVVFFCKYHSTSHAIITLIDSRHGEICCWPIFGYKESI